MMHVYVLSEQGGAIESVHDTLDGAQWSLFGGEEIQPMKSDGVQWTYEGWTIKRFEMET